MKNIFNMAIYWNLHLWDGQIFTDRMEKENRILITGFESEINFQIDRVLKVYFILTKFRYLSLE